MKKADLQANTAVIPNDCNMSPKGAKLQQRDGTDTQKASLHGSGADGEDAQRPTAEGRHPGDISTRRWRRGPTPRGDQQASLLNPGTMMAPVERLNPEVTTGQLPAAPGTLAVVSPQENGPVSDTYPPRTVNRQPGEDDH